MEATIREGLTTSAPIAQPLPSQTGTAEPRGHRMKRSLVACLSVLPALAACAPGHDAVQGRVSPSGSLTSQVAVTPFTRTSLSAISIISACSFTCGDLYGAASGISQAKERLALIPYAVRDAASQAIPDIDRVVFHFSSDRSQPLILPLYQSALAIEDVFSQLAAGAPIQSVESDYEAAASQWNTAATTLWHLAGRDLPPYDYCPTPL